MPVYIYKIYIYCPAPPHSIPPSILAYLSCTKNKLGMSPPSSIQPPALSKKGLLHTHSIPPSTHTLPSPLFKLGIINVCATHWAILIK